MTTQTVHSSQSLIEIDTLSRQAVAERHQTALEILDLEVTEFLDPLEILAEKVDNLPRKNLVQPSTSARCCASSAAAEGANGKGVLDTLEGKGVLEKKPVKRMRLHATKRTVLADTLTAREQANLTSLESLENLETTTTRQRTPRDPLRPARHLLLCLLIGAAAIWLIIKKNS